MQSPLVNERLHHSHELGLKGPIALKHVDKIFAMRFVRLAHGIGLHDHCILHPLHVCDVDTLLSLYEVLRQTYRLIFCGNHVSDGIIIKKLFEDLVGTWCTRLCALVDKGRR